MYCPHCGTELPELNWTTLPGLPDFKEDTLTCPNEDCTRSLYIVDERAYHQEGITQICLH